MQKLRSVYASTHTVVIKNTVQIKTINCVFKWSFKQELENAVIAYLTVVRYQRVYKHGFVLVWQNFRT